MNSLLSTNAQTDWESLTDEGIELNPAQIEQAVQMSQAIFYTPAQWQTYVSALALLGFEQWLEEWVPELTVDASECSLFNPVYASLIETVCHISVGSFHIGLIVTFDRHNSVIDCSKAAIELLSFIPDFYVLVEVLEEEMQVQVYGYQRQDKLLQHIQTQPDSLNSDWSYSLSLDWFNLEPTALLLELRCLSPTAIPHVAIAPPTLLPFEQIQERLITLDSQLQNPNHCPPQWLTWPEGATILSHPKLIHQLHQLGEADINRQEAAIAANVLTTTGCHINVASWLHDRLDAVAQELSWILMPTLTLAAAGLRTDDRFTKIQAALSSSSNIHIPPEARGAYQDFSLAPIPLRLYAITWLLPATNDSLEWSLVLVLGTTAGEFLPLGTALHVQAEGEVLVHQVAATTHDPYLYTYVVGVLDEQFQVNIVSSNGAVFSLPPLTFNLE